MYKKLNLEAPLETDNGDEVELLTSEAIGYCAYTLVGRYCDGETGEIKYGQWCCYGGAFRETNVGLRNREVEVTKYGFFNPDVPMPHNSFDAADSARRESVHDHWQILEVKMTEGKATSVKLA